MRTSKLTLKKKEQKLEGGFVVWLLRSKLSVKVQYQPADTILT